MTVDKARKELALTIAHPGMDLPGNRLRPNQCDVCKKALPVADAILAAGYRKVADDDATVGRLAKAIHEFDPVQCIPWEHMDGDYRVTRVGQAHAVVEALRGGAS